MAYARALAMQGLGPDENRLAESMRPHQQPSILAFTIASPLAMKVARDRIIASALPVLEERSARERLWFVTVILPGWYFPLSELGRADPRGIGEALRKRIIRLAAHHHHCAKGLLVGTLEVSLRTDKTGQPAGWQVHLHAITDIKMTVLLKGLQKAQFGEGPSFVRVPVMPVTIQPNSLARYVGYTFKIQVRCQNPACSNSTGDCRPAFPHELPSDVSPEALLWLDRWKLADLALVMGTSCLRSAFRMGW